MTKKKGRAVGSEKKGNNNQIVIGSYETVSVADAEAIKAAGLSVHTDADTELVSVSAADVAAHAACAASRGPSEEAENVL